MLPACCIPVCAALLLLARTSCGGNSASREGQADARRVRLPVDESRKPVSHNEHGTLPRCWTGGNESGLSRKDHMFFLLIDDLRIGRVRGGADSHRFSPLVQTFRDVGQGVFGRCSPICVGVVGTRQALADSTGGLGRHAERLPRVQRLVIRTLFAGHRVAGESRRRAGRKWRRKRSLPGRSRSG